jgi:hypothetical protein
MSHLQSVSDTHNRAGRAAYVVIGRTSIVIQLDPQTGPRSQAAQHSFVAVTICGRTARCRLPTRPAAAYNSLLS